MSGAMIIPSLSLLYGVLEVAMRCSILRRYVIKVHAFTNAVASVHEVIGMESGK